MASYRLPRGTTWPLTVEVKRVNGPGQPPTPVDLTGHHIMVTVRKLLVDGTADVTSPPVWQGDNLTLGGVTLASQSGATLGFCYSVMPPAATQVLPNPTSKGTALYYDITDNDGTGNEYQTEFGTILLLPRVGLSQP